MINHEKSLLEFNTQLEFVLSNYDSTKLAIKNYSNVVLGGLGGSGIGARITRGFFLDKANCPIEVFSDYFVPSYLNENSLVILSSYSGNTEETLEMFKQAIVKTQNIVIICSGGELMELAKQHGLAYFNVPTGFQPRMALGFSLGFLLLILGDLFSYNTRKELEEVLEIYKNAEEHIETAKILVETWAPEANLPVLVFCDEFLQGVAIRFCQQIQENAKGQAYAVVIPEANHNVTESIYNNLNVNILFLNSKMNKRNDLRFAFLENLLTQNFNSIANLRKNKTNLYSIFKSIYILDWVSILLSNVKKVDNMSVPNIDKLKQYLSDN